MMKTRLQCEQEIISAQAAYREAVEQGDQIGADLEEEVINSLLDLYDKIPQQRSPHD